jgi:hypothetical protein
MLPLIICAIATGLTILGCVVNVMRKWHAFLWWELANFIMIYHNIRTGDYYQVAYFLVLTGISGWGLYDRLKEEFSKKSS